MPDYKTSPDAIENLSDDVLVRFICDIGDPKYIEALYHRYSHLVYGICLYYLKDTAKSYDLAIEIFEKLLTKLPSSKFGDFRPWFHSFIRNSCLDHLRKQQANTKNQRKWVATQKSKDNFSENDGWLRLSKEIHKEDLLEKALLKLNDKQRRCIELFYFKKQSYREIAINSGEHINQVKSHLQNGKRNLRKWLSQPNKK